MQYGQTELESPCLQTGMMEYNQAINLPDFIKDYHSRSRTDLTLNWLEEWLIVQGYVFAISPQIVDCEGDFVR